MGYKRVKGNKEARLAALGRGDLFYTVATPCRNGHTSERYTCNALCRACNIIDARDRRKGYQESGHATNYQRKYRGWPVPTRADPGLCECCGLPPNGMSRYELSLDHCHASNVFRGWLCQKCNTGIGHLGDTIAGVRKALEYLLRAENNVANVVVSDSLAKLMAPAAA